MSDGTSVDTDLWRAMRPMTTDSILDDMIEKYHCPWESQWPEQAYVSPAMLATINELMEQWNNEPLQEPPSRVTLVNKE